MFCEQVCDDVGPAVVVVFQPIRIAVDNIRQVGRMPLAILLNVNLVCRREQVREFRLIQFPAVLAVGCRIIVRNEQGRQP